MCFPATEDARDASDSKNSGEELTTDSAQTTRTDGNISDESTANQECCGNDEAHGRGRHQVSTDHRVGEFDTVPERN
jgi:hypothetical protein